VTRGGGPDKKNAGLFEPTLAAWRDRGAFEQARRLVGTPRIASIVSEACVRRIKARVDRDRPSSSVVDFSPDRSARRLGRAGVVVDMTFPPVLLLDLRVGDVHVLERRVVVLVRVRRREMAPVLTSMEIVRHVVVLVTMLGGRVLVMTL
jgi:hypothetical protein